METTTIPDNNMEQHFVNSGMEQHFVMDNDALVDVLPVAVYDEKNAPELFQTDEEIAQEFLENLEHQYDFGNNDGTSL